MALSLLHERTGLPQYREAIDRAAMYVDALYIAVLARLLAANVLAGRALLSEDTELAEILNGHHFVTQFRYSAR